MGSGKVAEWFWWMQEQGFRIRQQSRTIQSSMAMRL